MSAIFKVPEPIKISIFILTHEEYWDFLEILEFVFLWTQSSLKMATHINFFLG